MPAASPRPVITIVGGGFAGTALALALARQPGPLAADIHLLEPRPASGPGLAYLTERPEYLLNVRAGALSVLPDEPAHFAAWLATQPESDGGAPEFAARATYGRYLHQTLASVLDRPLPNGCRVRWHNQAATAAPARPEGRRAVRLAGGGELLSDYVVLALGNFAPPPPVGPDQRYLAHPGYHGDPWAPGLLGRIGADEPVLLIGSGLTAVDVLLGLRQTGHRAPIMVVARHGRWPAVHGPATASYPRFYEELAGKATVLEVLAELRHHVRGAAAQGLDWRPVLDALRPDLGRIWAAWPLAEQARFLRHLGSIWSVLRHRSPPQNAAAIAEMTAAGQLKLHAGRVNALEPCGPELRVQACPNAAPACWLRARHVINCTGPLLDYHRIRTPLVSSLRAAGELQPDSLGLGILTNEHGALLRAAGPASPDLFTLGASRRPAYFESTAVPELRQQAAALATELSRRLLH
ncbi:FAD/NAD(P)-binding protein [uncultured Hymenobacter sp.]|uniref:FAD/NAD(P)-binding protein n=1 Tax=uncultured Hymenobacter sp. TaxID=170016 RepID=UPI0035CA26EC